MQGDAEVLEGGYLHTPRKAVQQEMYHHRQYPNSGSAHLLRNPIRDQNAMDTSRIHRTSVPVNKGNRSSASRDEEHIKRIKDYQSKLLERQKQKQRLIEERQMKIGLDNENQWLPAMTNGGGQAFLTSDLPAHNQKPNIWGRIPLSTQMANGQYFNATSDTGSNLSSNMEVPPVPENVGDRLGNKEGHSVTSGVFETNTYPPEHVTDSPNHRVQDWLSYYQQLSSKEQSPVVVSENNLATKYVTSGEVDYLDSLSRAANNIYSGPNADIRNYVVKEKIDTDTILSNANANPERNTHHYELTTYSRHLLQDTDENKPAEKKNQSDSPEDEAASYHVHDRNARHMGSVDSISSRLEELNLQNERESLAQLNDISLGPSSTIGHQPSLLPSYTQTNVPEVHVPHELSTIQELEEQSTRKLSQMQSVSTTKKRLSSSPIKEDASDVSDLMLLSPINIQRVALADSLPMLLTRVNR